MQNRNTLAWFSIKVNARSNFLRMETRETKTLPYSFCLNEPYLFSFVYNSCFWSLGGSVGPKNSKVERQCLIEGGLWEWSFLSFSLFIGT